MKPLIALKSCNFKLEISKNNHGVSSFGGIPLIHKALNEIGLVKKIQDTFYLKGYLKHGGYQDAQILEAVILLLASGGTCFSDWKILTCDPGFQKMFGACMSVDVIERYLTRLSVTFINTKTEKGRVGYSTLLEIIQREMIVLAYQLAGSPEHLTVDIDSSIYRSNKHYDSTRSGRDCLHSQFLITTRTRTQTKQLSFFSGTQTQRGTA